MKNGKTLLIILISSFLLLTGCAGSADLSVQTAAAEVKALSTNAEVSGVLIPKESVNLSAKISGKVAAANFEVGDTVMAGQTLVQLDTTEINAQLSVAQAAYSSAADQVKQAKIPLDSAATELKRMQTLFAEGAVSQLQLDQAQSAYDTAKAKYDGTSTSGLSQAKAAVDSASAQLANAKMVSPINGVVVTKNIHTGELATVGATLVSIADISELKLKGTISQELFPYLSLRQTVKLSIDAFAGKDYEGTISLLGPISVGTGTYFPIELSFENTGEITAGLSAHSIISIAGSDGIVVPASAVVKESGETYVFVIGDGVAVKRLVKTGLSNPDEVEITDGLLAGENVAVTNANILVDQMRVIVKN